MWGILNFIMFIVLVCSPETFFGILAIWLFCKHPIICGVLFVGAIILGILGGDGAPSYSSSDYSDGGGDSDNGSILDDMAVGVVAGMMIESAYREDVKREAERQKLLEKDPMAEFRV